MIHTTRTHIHTHPRTNIYMHVQNADPHWTPLETAPLYRRTHLGFRADYLDPPHREVKVSPKVGPPMILSGPTEQASHYFSGQKLPSLEPSNGISPTKWKTLNSRADATIL
jgi:hypothetical protein